MAQPNVVREPSMDEILASIRRIIESNEPVPQAGMAAGRAEPEGFMGHPANDDSEVTLTIDEAFAEPDDYTDTASNISAGVYHQPQSASQVQPVERKAPVQPPRTLSLADVAARVRAASERGSAERVVQDAPAQPAPAFEERLRVEDVGPASVAPVAEELPEVEPDTAFIEEAAPPEQPAPAKSVSLLSSNVGEQVARSFQSLALAVDDAERRSLDRMAEDMLRPMLQEWLDDNLPTLVERLVREEIERVARGSRR